MIDYTDYQVWILLRELRDLMESGRSDIALREIARRMSDLGFDDGFGEVNR